MSHDPTISQDAADLQRARQRSSQRTRPPVDVPGYEFERFLGAGAFGEVWVAVDRNTGRRVAVKFYTHRGGVDWSLLSREVEKLAFLFADRYVVQLVDVGWNADPPYYVMEYLERGSLADRLQTGPMSVTEAVGMFRDIAVGLVHAHDKGVLHCDLKPANVLLDNDNRPRLADFGQSRMSTEQTPALGTLFYMAPEQADHEAAPDARWDVYALGALLYCMLLGDPPHRSPQVLADIERGLGLTEKLENYRRLLSRAPLPVQHRRLPGVDRELADIIDRCLQPNPSRRFPNPQAVVSALDARGLRRARRPLLVLGAVGPAVLLLVLSWFAWRVFDTAVGESDETLVRKALETDGFAAEFVAETVAAQIERRWNTLERETSEPAIRAMLDSVSAAPRVDDAQRRAAQTWLEAAAAQHPDSLVASWTVMDAKGNQLARVPYEKRTIGQNYAFRDYFNGRGDQAPGTADIEPIRDVHISNVFVSTATGERKVAFSAPVWSTEADRSKRRVVGVLSVTVALGNFAELRSGGADGRTQVAVLADAKPDSSKKPGSVLEHPHLSQLVHNAPAGAPIPAYYFDEAGVERLRELVAPQKDPALRSVVVDRDYRDPVGADASGENYSGRWLAAFRPVIVNERSEGPRDTGWVVIVQEPHATAVQPAQELGQKLVRYGLTALGIVIGVVTVLWGVVMIVLNESPRLGLTAFFRRRAGLPTNTSGTSGSTGAALKSPIQQRTETARPRE